MDTLLSMRVFRQVVESGSFVAAAERLEISTAMTSKHIAHLEDYLGTRLLNRTTRKLSLTESGQAYYDLSAQALTDLEDARRAVSDATITPRGTLKVNSLVSLGVTHLAPGISEYTTKYPQVAVELTLNDRVVDLIEEGYDVAIRATAGDLQSSTLVARQIASARFVACAAASYLKRHGTPQSPTDLAGHNCLVYAYTTNPKEWTFGSGDAQQRVTISGNFISNNGDAVRVAAVAGSGITFLPTDIIGDDLRAGRLVPLFPHVKQPEIGIYAVYPSRRHLSAKVRTFVDFLADRFARKPLAR